ncbi:hypothetical protein [Sporosarcina sp. NPDC096371]|uniref:hypothetical protein n=1 Tax=Sporosarcina sp. NPDC096371 TaxID=3364530 RepID=UPI00380EF3FE
MDESHQSSLRGHPVSSEISQVKVGIWLISLVTGGGQVNRQVKVFLPIELQLLM